MQHLAEKLETAIKERRPREEIDIRLNELKMPLEKLISQLEPQLAEKLLEEAVTIDQEVLKAVCDKLAAMLADDDAEAVDVLEANAGLLNAAFSNHYRKINDGVQTFDFEAALAALRVATGTSA